MARPKAKVKKSLIVQKIVKSDRDIVDFHLSGYNYSMSRPEMISVIMADFNNRYPAGYFTESK